MLLKENALKVMLGVGMSNVKDILAEGPERNED